MSIPLKQLPAHQPFPFRDIVMKLIAMKASASALMLEIDEEYLDSEMLTGPLYSVMHDLDAMVGALFVRANESGAVIFQDSKPPMSLDEYGKSFTVTVPEPVVSEYERSVLEPNFKTTEVTP